MAAPLAHRPARGRAYAVGAARLSACFPLCYPAMHFAMKTNPVATTRQVRDREEISDVEGVLRLR